MLRKGLFPPEAEQRNQRRLSSQQFQYLHRCHTHSNLRVCLGGSRRGYFFASAAWTSYYAIRKERDLHWSTSLRQKEERSTRTSFDPWEIVDKRISIAEPRISLPRFQFEERADQSTSASQDHLYDVARGASTSHWSDEQSTPSCDEEGRRDRFSWSKVALNHLNAMNHD